MRKWEFEAIGTHWTIDVFQEVADDNWVELQKTVDQRIEKFDKTYSRFRDDSIVSTISKKAGLYNFPEDSVRIFEIYQKLYKLSEGKVTPLMGRILRDAGYDKSYSLKPNNMLVSPPRWEEVMTFSQSRLEAKVPLELDFGAAGKGYLIDLVYELISKMGFTEIGVEAGGDMRFGGKNNYTIGLENPDNVGEIIGTVEIENKSICGSAGNRRQWDKYNHIINPLTKESPNWIKAIWVTAKDTITADALTTGLYFTEVDKLKSEFEFEYLIIKADNGLVKSSGFEANLYI